MKVRISTGLLRFLCWGTAIGAFLFAGRTMIGWAEDYENVRIRDHKNALTRIDAMIYQASKPPTGQDMAWLADRDRNKDYSYNFEFGKYSVLYQNVQTACLRDGKMEIEWINQARARELRYFSNVESGNTKTIFNVEDGPGWLIHVLVGGGHEGSPYIYAIILHLPKDYRLETCR